MCRSDQRQIGVDQSWARVVNGVRVDQIRIWAGIWADHVIRAERSERQVGEKLRQIRVGGKNIGSRTIQCGEWYGPRGYWYGGRDYNKEIERSGRGRQVSSVGMSGTGSNRRRWKIFCSALALGLIVMQLKIRLLNLEWLSRWWMRPRKRGKRSAAAG